MTTRKLPKGSKLSLVKTEGLMSCSYPLFDLRGLSAGKVHLLFNLLTQAKLDHNPLAADMLVVFPETIDR